LNNLDDKAKDFINLILSSTNAVALTGAGISTESGIPDYRSPGTGLWGKMDQSVVSLDGFLRDPTRYYSYALELYPVRQSAKPNPAHYLLAEFEKKELLKGIITQNVDGLHQDAGSGNVHELHGSLRQAVCLDCSLLYPMDSVMKRVISGENPPLCKECSGVLKPNAVFFWRNASPCTVGKILGVDPQDGFVFGSGLFSAGISCKYPSRCCPPCRDKAGDY